MKQRTFFDSDHEADIAAERGPSDPNVAPGDRKRLTGQNARILERLRRGPATAAELSLLSLKYTSRISDLRSHGHDVQCTRHPDGNSVYTLNGE